MPLDFTDLKARVKGNLGAIYNKDSYEQLIKDLRESWQKKQINITQLRELMRDLLHVCAELNRSTNELLISDTFKRQFMPVVRLAKQALYHDYREMGPAAASLDSKILHDTNTAPFDVLAGKSENDEAADILDLMGEVIEKRNAYVPPDPALKKGTTKKQKKGSLLMAKLTAPEQTLTIVDDNRYAQIAGKTSPQAIRLARVDRVHESKTNFVSFHKAVAAKFNGLASEEVHGKRTPTRSIDEQGYIKADKKRAYGNTKLRAKVEDAGTPNERVVVEVDGATGSEKILTVFKDKLICTSDLITILDPEARAKLTGIGADAVKSAAPAIADGYREMIQNAGIEYDVRFAIVNLLDDDDKEISPGTNNLDDAKLLVDLARNAYIAGAVPILNEAQLKCIQNLRDTGTGAYKTYADNILKLDEQVFGKVGTPGRKLYGKVADTDAAKAVQDYKDLFNVGAARNTKVVDVTPASVTITPIKIIDPDTNAEVLVAATDLEAGKILVMQAKEALEHRAMPYFSQEQLACIENLAKHGRAGDKVLADRILRIDQQVFGDHTVDPNAIPVETVAAGLREAAKVFPPVLGNRVPKPETGPFMPSKSPASKRDMSLTKEEIQKITEALKAQRLIPAGSKEASKAVIDEFNKELNKRGVTNDSRDRVIEFCCREIGIPNIAAPAKPITGEADEEEDDLELPPPLTQSTALLTREEEAAFRVNFAAAGVIDKAQDDKIARINEHLASLKGSFDRKAKFAEICKVESIAEIKISATPKPPEFKAPKVNHQGQPIDDAGEVIKTTVTGNQEAFSSSAMALKPPVKVDMDKYKKMRDVVKMPEAAILNVMIRDNVSFNDMKEFFALGATAPEAKVPNDLFKHLKA